MPRMKNLWIGPHLGEITGCLESLTGLGFASVVIHRKSKWQVPSLNLELWRIGEGQKNLHTALRQILEQNFEHVHLIGIAGALNSELALGSIVTQSAQLRRFALVDRPVTTTAERAALALTSKKDVVVMESFWSDDEPKDRLAPEIFFETRVISDHGENLNLQEIQKNLPAWMGAIVEVALPRLKY